MPVRRHTRTMLIAAAGLALGASVVCAWMAQPQSSVGPCALVQPPASVPGLVESSGVAISRRTPGVLWSHNDSGNDSILFAIEPNGTARGRMRVPVRMRDWEDISA